MGHEVVLWTTRNGDELEAAIKWCKDLKLNFCSVNEPAPSNEKEYRDKYSTQSRKIYADIYIDDHNLEFQCGFGLDRVVRYLTTLGEGG